MPSLKFDAVIETVKVVSGFQDIQNAVHKTAAAVESEGKSIDDIINKIQNTANIAIGGWSIGKFVSQMMQVRGQFQQTEMAFKTMLQSEEKAKDLMQQLINTAAITPFGVDDVTEGAKQLLAFNVAAKDVNDTLIRLGDVAAGMGVSLSEMVMLYGTTIAKGKMDTMDLYQFLNRGIPIADELAKVMGLDVNNAIAEVKEQLTAGKVTSDIFIKAMQNMTSEGSKFGGMMKAQSKTITGQISNIEDAIEQMFNELGRSQEGIINTGLDAVSTIVENWRKVGEVVMVAATAYGTYKAVLMAVSALQVLNNRILQQAVVEKTLAAAAGINLSNAEAVAAARTKFLTLTQQGLTTALKETAAATLLNPYVLMAAAITSLVYTVYKFSTAASSAEIAQNAWNKSIDEFNKKAEDRKQKIKELVQIIQGADTTSLDKQLAFDELGTIAPDLTKVYDSVKKLEDTDLTKFNKQLNEMTGKEREEGLKAQIKQLQAYARALQDNSASAAAGSARRNAMKGLKDNYGIEAPWSLNKDDKLNDAIFDYIEKIQGELDKVQKAKEELETPTKIDIKLAEEDYKQSKDELDYLSRFALAMKNDIEKKPTNIPFEGRNAEKVIVELEDKVNNLKKEQEEHPIQFTADKKKALDKYQELLGDIKRWKNTAWKQGVFTIPVEIQFKMKQLQDETDKAKGHFNYVTGKYEEANKDESYAAAKKRAKINYQAAVKAEKEARKGSNKDWENAKEELDAKKKEYEKYWGSISEASSKANKSMTDAKKRAEEQRKAQEELSNALKELVQKNMDDEISIMREGTEKKLKEIDNDYKKRIAEIKKQETEFKKKNKEAGKKEALTSAQSDALNKARDLATKEYNKKLDEVNKEALTSMRDYLKEYGSFYQQKKAIAEEYEEKIKDAQTEGERKTLRKQMERELSKFTFENISMGIDWKALLGGVQNLSQEMLKPMLDQLEAYTKTDGFKSADMNERQQVVELIKELRQYVGTDQNQTWKDLEKAVTDFTNAVAAYKEAEKNEKDANQRVNDAKGKLERGEIGQKEYDSLVQEANRLGDKTAQAKVEMTHLGNTLNETGEKIKEYVSPLTAALKNAGAWKGVQGFDQVKNSVGGFDQLKGALDSILPAMGDGMAKTIGTGLSSALGSTLSAAGNGLSSILSSGMGGVIGIVAQIPRLILDLVDNIKNMVVGILDSFTELISLRWIDDLVVSILDAVGNLIDAIFDLPENLFHVLEGIVVRGAGGLLNGVLGRVGNILSFGALSSGGPASWFSSSNAKKVNDTIERLTDRNTKLQQSIEDLTDAMEKSYGSKATSYYEQAYKNQEETNQNYLEIAKARAGYHGKHRSWKHYWSGFDDSEMDWIKKNVKSDFNGDLFSLSPEEMKILRSNVDIWEHIKNTGKGSYGEKLTDKLDDYIDQAGKLDELSDKFKENLTQISFDSMKDSFISDLMDMSKEAKDFTDDFAEMMQKALLTYSMEDLINGDLKKLYDDWAKTIKDKDGNLTEADIEAFNKRYDGIVQEGVKRRDNWAKVTGYTGSSSSSQTATSGGWASVGQDSIDELNGRFTALQIAGESISSNMLTTVAQMETIVATGISTNGAVLEIRNMMIMTNSYLEDIVKYSKLTYNDFGTKLDDMNRRLKDI